MVKPMIFLGRSTSEFAGCCVTDVKRYPPAPKTAVESIPYKDGAYNYSLHGGRLFYENCKVVYTLAIYSESFEQAAATFEAVQKWLYSGMGILTDGFISDTFYTGAYCTGISEIQEIGTNRRCISFDVTMTADPFPTREGARADIVTAATGASGKTVFRLACVGGRAYPFTAVYTGTEALPTDCMEAVGAPSTAANAFFVDVTLPTKYAAVNPSEQYGCFALSGEPIPTDAPLKFFTAGNADKLIIRFSVSGEYTPENVAAAKAAISHARWYLGDESYSAPDLSNFVVYSDFAETVTYNGKETVPNTKFTLSEGLNVVTVTGLEGIKYTLTYDSGAAVSRTFEAMSLTQAEYDRLGSYDDNILYYITDSDPPKVYKGADELTGGGTNVLTTARANAKVLPAYGNSRITVNS